MNNFTVEFGDEANRTQLVKVLQQTVRGHFSLIKLKRRDAGRIMSNMPDIPGMQMIVKPRASEAIFIDQLADNSELCSQIDAVKNHPEAGPIRRDGKTMPSVLHEVKHKLDPDRFKTLVYELAFLVEEGLAKVIQGDIPTKEQIDKLPGRELNDVMNSSALKPKYRDEVQAWEDKLTASE